VLHVVLSLVAKLTSFPLRNHALGRGSLWRIAYGRIAGANGVWLMAGGRRSLWRIADSTNREEGKVCLVDLVYLVGLVGRGVEKGSGTICAERPAGHSDKWFLTPSPSRLIAYVRSKAIK
jgi:hypothetical protein